MILWLPCVVIGYDGMVMCYESMTVSRLRIAWSMWLKVLRLEVNQREHMVTTFQTT